MSLVTVREELNPPGQDGTPNVAALAAVSIRVVCLLDELGHPDFSGIAYTHATPPKAIGGTRVVYADKDGAWSAILNPNKPATPDDEPTDDTITRPTGTAYQIVVTFKNGDEGGPRYISVPDGDVGPLDVTDLLVEAPDAIPDPAGVHRLDDLDDVAGADNAGKPTFFIKDPDAADTWGPANYVRPIIDGTNPGYRAYTGGDGNDKDARLLLVAEGVWQATDRNGLDNLGTVRVKDPEEDTDAVNLESMTTAIGAASSDFTDELAAEAAARIAGDSAEATARAAAVSAEASTRSTADTTEAATRAAADTTEATTRAAAITTEATARAAADSTEAAARAAADTTEATARAAADALLIPLTQKAAANGVATLDGSGLIPQAQLPAIALTEFLTPAPASQAAMLALVGQRGDWTTRTDLGTDWQVIAEPSSVLGNWRQMTYPASPVSSVNGRTGAVTGLAEYTDVTSEAATRAAADTSEATTRAAADTTEAATRASADTTETTRATAAEALLAPKASPTLTGTVTIPDPTTATGALNRQFGDGRYDPLGAALPAASSSETSKGTLATKTVTPAGLNASMHARRRLFAWVIDEGGAVISTGVKALWMSAVCDAVITDWSVLTDTAATCTIDLLGDTYANFPPTGSDSYPGAGTKPNTSAARKNAGSNMASWTTQVTQGDVFDVEIEANNNATRIVIEVFGKVQSP